MRSIPIAFLVLVALPVLASAQGSETAQTISTRLLPPARVGAFQRVAQGQLEGRAGGQLRYRSPAGLEVVATLHPVPVLPSCEEQCDSVTVHLAAQALAAAPTPLATSAVDDSLVVERDEVIRAPYAGGTAYGRRLVVSWLSGGKRVRSDLSLYALGPYLVEVRATFSPRPELDGLPVRFGSEFVQALGREAREATACASGPADPEVIRLGEPSRLGIEELRRRVEPVLAGFGFQLDPEANERDVWRSVPFEGWPSGVDYGPWARQASPGFRVAVRLEDGAGAARITVSAEASCAPSSPDDEARSLELSLELMTARAVLEELEGRRTQR